MLNLTRIEQFQGLWCEVLCHRNNNDCSNNGLSSKKDNLTLLPESVADGAGDETLILVYRKRFQDLIAVPTVLYNSTKHYMFGGNFIWSCDSRFPHDYPIKIHDRVE
jgi:hypothetical protein